MAGFQDIVGQEQIITHWKTAIAQEKVSHAYILNGPEHAGKSLLADAFAMALVCEHPDADKRPCGCCRSCRQAAEHGHPDIIYVKREPDKTRITVNVVREQITESVALKPYSGRRKVYIVEEAELMWEDAQNKLLKTLEEPPLYVVILLLTTNAALFLATVRSRCITLHLKAVPKEQIRAHLMAKCGVPDYHADLCAAFSQGNVGHAVRLASDPDFQSLIEDTPKLIEKLPGMTVSAIAARTRQMAEQKKLAPEFLDLLLVLFRDILLYKSTGREDMLTMHRQPEFIMRCAQRFSYTGLNEILNAIETTRRRLAVNVSFELTLEVLLLKIKENMT